MSINYENSSIPYINKLISRFLKLKSEVPVYFFNVKNANQIVQTCYSLYPPLIQNFTYNKETGHISYNRLSTEEIKNKLQNENNPFSQHFDSLYEVYENCRLIGKQNTSDTLTVESQVKQVLYVEANNIGKLSYYILKPKLEDINSMFQRHVVEALMKMENVKFHPTVRAGIYEVDVVIYPDTILEVYGEAHYIQETNNELLLNYQVKLK